MSTLAIVAVEPSRVARGIGMSLLAYASFSTADALLKASSGAFSVFQIAFTMAFFAMLPVLATTIGRGGLRSLVPRNKPLVAARGILAAICGCLAWSAFAYGRGVGGEPARGQLETCLKGVEIVLHNQDNREHDLLDSDDYYQFQGGLAVSVRALKGGNPTIYHADHSRPETPRVRRLKEEIGRVVRGRAANPKWIAGVMRHGYKGAFEIAATVDYLFAYAATAAVVEDHHFEALFDAYLADEEVRGFIADANPAALAEIEARFQEAVRRGLWRPRRNDVAARLGMG